jgi:hypothetical protein
MSNPTTTRAMDKYRDGLRNLPPSGGGGCHVALLSVANLGRRAGVAREQIERDLSEHVHGTRHVSTAEIVAAVNKAFTGAPTAMPLVNPSRPPFDAARALNDIMKRGAGFTEADVWQFSPVRIDWPPERDAVEVLKRLYRPDDCVFIGARHDSGAEHVLPVAEWIARFERGTAVPEHIVPNPLSGKPGVTKDGGKISYRADACVARFRMAVVEFDAMPRAQQIEFWCGVRLPVIVLVDSCGKSIHAWIQIDADDADDWTRRVELDLFSMLTQMGADGACKNEARLSRMPGAFRSEKNAWQRLLYLNPMGDRVNPL